MITRYVLSSVLAFYGAACLAQSDSITFQLILIGDAGTLEFPIKDVIEKNIQPAGLHSAVVYLGDNVYPKGLSDPGDKDRKTGESILLNQISLASGFGETYFVPGNHDWKNGHHDGFRYVVNQQKFLDSLKNPLVHMLPRDGCPGPEEVHLTGDVVMVVLDTQWFLHPWDRPEADASPCEAKTSADVTIQLDDILNRNRGKRIVVVGHHPVFSNGPNGGVFTLKDHLFPLTEISGNLYVPLPIVGSLVPLYRKIFGDIQDIAHPQNKAMRRGLQDILEQYPGTVYVSGHEHALQHFESDSIHYIGSGSGAKSSFVKQKEFSRFASPEIGFARLLVSKDGYAEVQYYARGGKLFSISLPRVIRPTEQKSVLQDQDTLWVTTNASYRYQAGAFRRSLLGDNYRAEWAQRIPLMAFDIGNEKGGLKILQKGGGLETMALRLRDSAGFEYNLRTVDKYPTKALPKNFQKTFIEMVKQDQVSAAHPYAALVIPALAQTAGIYHTRPRLTYAPVDLRWGIYAKDFAGQIMLFEERPDGGKAMPMFGNPHRIISTRRLLEHMAHDNLVQVDQKLVLRSRLFDMWIGDWDRHDDQWRWGEFDEKKVKVYRPIPRDRDQAFFVNQGFVPNGYRKRAVSPQLEGFDYRIRWAPGLMHVGRWFDRTFLNAIPERQFVEEARLLAERMTDASIDSALKTWPPEIYGLHGKEIAEKLKARKSILANQAQSYYTYLSKQVDVVGSNKRELFEATWLPGGTLELKMFKLDKEGRQGKLLYEREFVRHQTRELRLYGLEGDDVFHFAGQGHGDMKVRLIGGGGMDVARNESVHSSKITLYDERAGAKIEGAGIRDRTSSDPLVNEYDRKDYEYDKFLVKNTLAYNVDDGIFIGTGFTATSYGFRKKPYEARHILQGSYAIRTKSFNIHYEGRFTQLVGKWDLEVDADVKSPNYVNNFFGWGNESVFDQNIKFQPDITVTNSIDYYRLRFREIKLEVRLRRKIGQWGYFRIGPVFQRGEIVEPTEDRYIKEYAATLPEPILAIPKNFGGVSYTWGIDHRDNNNYTTRGIVFRQTSRYMDGFDAPSFSSHTATFTLYQSFKLPARVTYVFNAGAGHNTGSYQLYQAQALDGKTEIRGYRKTRFYGDTKVYFNNEVRIKMGSLRTYLFPAAFGVHMFYDVGRVWYRDSTGVDPSAPTGNSDVWHRGYGGGLWFAPYNVATIVSEVAHSNEETLFYLRLGFLF